MTNTDPPFSARSRGKHQQIDEAFPETARTGLLHIVFGLIDRDYLSGWAPVARELQRIGRLSPQEYARDYVPSLKQAKSDAVSALSGLSWQGVYDFCERLYGHLACDVGYHEEFGDFHVSIPKSEVQAYIATELNRLFLEEDLAYEFDNGLVKRRGRKHTVETTSRAQVVLGDSRLSGARKHYSKALYYYRDTKKPDYENAVKEAVCACEAAGKVLFPDANAATLGGVAKWLSNSRNPPIPKALAQTITATYAYRSGGEGVGHGGASGGVATASVAEYVMAVCASQIIYFVDLANEDESEIPF